MKALFSVLSFLVSTILSTQSFGQPELTNNVFPDIGDTIVYSKGNTSGVFEGDSGPNAIWDFSALQPQSGSAETMRIYLNPSGTPYEGQFLNSNLCYKETGTSTLYTYLKKETNKLIRLGTASVSSTRKFSNPDEFLKTPLNYLGQLNDDFVATITSNVPTANPSYQHGSTSIEYDAYGTLTLPQGTFNAYRLKIEESRVDSIIQSIGDCEVQYVSISRYTWYVPHVPDLVLTIAYISGIKKIYANCTGSPTVSNITPSKSITYRSNNINILSNIYDVTSSGSLALNSAFFKDGGLTVSINSSSLQNCLIKLMSIDGISILEETTNLVEGENRLNYYPPPLKTGFYLLSLIDNKGTILSKAIVNATN